jgi:DNA modification methylase
MRHEILCGDVLDGLRSLPSGSVQCVVTSPPYWGLRNYNVEGQIGLEPTPEMYVEKMVEVFREVRRVLRDDGVVWLNLGDSYTSGNRETNGTREGYKQQTNRGASGECDAPRLSMPPGLKPKDLVGIPWRVAFALQADGWYLRSDIIWSKSACVASTAEDKPNPMPESVTDRPTKSHEYVFLLAKQERYFYDADAVHEPTTSDRVRGPAKHPSKDTNGNDGLCRRPIGEWRNRRTVWEIATQPFSADLQTAHYARVGLGAVSDGMTHIVSPNCPVHGGLVDLLTTVICGGRVDDLLSHIERSDTRRVQELLSDCAPTGWNLAQDYGLDNLGSLLRECVRSATQHNMQIHKKGRDPATSPACMPSDGTSFHTDDKQALREFFEQQKSILSNNTLPDELDAHSLGRIPFRNAGILLSNIHNNCMCSFYKSFTKKTDHFATFPEALVEPCIKAGTSERGCCPTCGAPWEREVETTRVPDPGRRAVRQRRPDEAWNAGRGQPPHTGYRGLRDSVTTGWRPTCTCDVAETVPCVVLDPFGGSGTVAKVARDLGRSSILIELNPEYVRIAKKRLRVGEQLDTGVCEYVVREVRA